MHADEVNTNASLISQLVKTQYSQWANLPIKKLCSAGTDNALYRLGEEMLVRLPRTPSAAAQVEKEQRWLPEIAPLLPLAVPPLLAVGMPAEDYPWHWSIYQWLAGEDASVSAVSDMRQTAVTLAQFLSALHQIDLKGGPLPGEHNFFRGAPLAAQDKVVHTALISLQPFFNTELVLKIWNDSLKAAVQNDSFCWIHGDLIPTNLLIQDGQLSAVIDFGGLGVGDPACDLMVAWTFLSAEVRNIFRSELGVDDATWARGKGWALSFGLIAFEYYQEINPVLAGIAKHAIAEVIADEL